MRTLEVSELLGIVTASEDGMGSWNSSASMASSIDKPYFYPAFSLRTHIVSGINSSTPTL